MNPPTRRMLLAYRRYREAPPTLSALLRPALPRFVLMLAVAGSSFFVSSYLGVGLLGMALGAALRHLSISLQARRAIPVLVEVIDWEETDRRLAAGGSR